MLSSLRQKSASVGDPSSPCGAVFSCSPSELKLKPLWDSTNQGTIEDMLVSKIPLFAQVPIEEAIYRARLPADFRRFTVEQLKQLLKVRTADYFSLLPRLIPAAVFQLFTQHYGVAMTGKRTKEFVVAALARHFSVALNPRGPPPASPPPLGGAAGAAAAAAKKAKKVPKAAAGGRGAYTRTLAHVSLARHSTATSCSFHLPATAAL